MAESEWFTYVQTAGICSTFLFTAYQLRKERTSRVVANEIKLIELHRDLWKLTIEDSALRLPFTHGFDESKITSEQKQFLSLFFLHVSGSYRLTTTKQVMESGEFEKDIKATLSAPAVRNFWEANKAYYDQKFATFVDGLLPERGQVPKEAPKDVSA